ncbi:hypothetical protein BS50DRAFT_623063 [Corynespora cassiicola Philippines]|uniref:LRAT domain-containing protein n=1 Tax=Corynespora cassiicola Philippines TaxID=1448308 RepID=A0A2T2NGE4_CORCC|nr:hypothetical protein BS50DRAFT_623063 [Corynespora cassiicola Philippines]
MHLCDYLANNNGDQVIEIDEIASFDSSRNSDGSEHDEATMPTQTHDVFLVRYMLSHSASCPPLTRWFLQFFEKSAPPSWLSHYALRIGDFYFDLYREGSIPFASIAYFRIVNSKDTTQMARTFGSRPKWIDEDLKLGTVSLSPEDIIAKLYKEDQIFKQAFLSSSNCLLEVPREYSLMNANCQHFIIELTRRIGVNFDEGKCEWLLKSSMKPRLLCLGLLIVGSIICPAVFTTCVLRFKKMSLIFLTIVHTISWMVVVRDSTTCEERCWRLRNNWRYLGIKGYEDLCASRFYLWDFSRYISWRILLIVHLFGPFSLVDELLLPFKSSTSIFLFGILYIYCLFVLFLAYMILSILKSKTGVAKKREKEEKKRVQAAYTEIERLDLPNSVLNTLFIMIHGEHSKLYLCDGLVEGFRSKEFPMFAQIKELTGRDFSSAPFGENDLRKAVRRVESQGFVIVGHIWLKQVYCFMPSLLPLITICLYCLYHPYPSGTKTADE